MIRDLVVEYPARPVFRCLLAHLCAQLGRMDDARREFEKFASGDFAVLPFDMEWLLGMSLLAETCSLVNDADRAEVLHRLLLPWAGFNVADYPEAVRGSVSRYLGILATTMSLWDDAINHFENALKMNEQMGARPWFAYTQHDYARMLLARDLSGDRDRAELLLAKALATYGELGMATSAASASALATDIGLLAP